MQANDLILFSQVVELGSFSQAAQANQLANSVVSKRIARLEADLGVQLLYRTTRKLTMTEAGKILAQSAKNVRQATIEAADAISGFGENVSGHIKMSVPTISGDLILAEAVAEFCSQHSGLTVDMSLENRFVDLIQEGYDLVIRTGCLDDSSLISRHLINSEWVVCASPSYLKQYGSPKQPTDLAQHNCLRYTHWTKAFNGWEFKPCKRDSKSEPYLVNVTGSFSTNNATALRKAILGGYGIAYVPRCLVYPDLTKGSLIELFPDLVNKNMGVYAVYPYTKHPPQKIKQLIEFIKSRYQAKSHFFVTPQTKNQHN